MNQRFLFFKFKQIRSLVFYYAVKIINFSTEFVIMHLDLDNTLKEMFQQINIYTKIKELF